MDKWDVMLKAELNKKAINLNQFVIRCCHGLNVGAQQVIDNLLSLDDKQDIINGDIPFDCLRAHIEAWTAQGIPHYTTQLG